MCFLNVEFISINFFLVTLLHPYFSLFLMSLSQWTRVHSISICDFSLFFHYQFLVVYHCRWKRLINRISVIQRLLSLLWVLTDYLPQRMPCVCMWTISIPLLLNGIQYMSVSPFGLKNSSDPMIPYWFFIQIVC